MPVLNLRGDWFALQDNIGIHDIIDVSRVTLIWNVQNIIDLKDQMQFKVLLANRWSLAPSWGAIQVPRRERRIREYEVFSTCEMA